MKKKLKLISTSGWQSLKFLTLSVVIGLTLGGGLIITKAWTEPSTSPPGGNLGAPINTGLTGQTKSGNLQVNALGISGTENALLVPNGNVGIGTTSPSYNLDVQGGNARVKNLEIGSLEHGDTWPGIKASSSSQYALIQNTDGLYTLINKKSGGGYIGFRVDNANKVIINDAGKVGIGTTDPINSQLRVVSSDSWALRAEGTKHGGYFDAGDGYYGVYTPDKIYAGGNSYADDFYIRDIGKWASQMGGGLSGYEIKLGSGDSGFNTSATDTVSCSVGKIIIGGGCSGSGGYVKYTAPVNNGWKCTVSTGNVRAHAICVDP